MTVIRFAQGYEWLSITIRGEMVGRGGGSTKGLELKEKHCLLRQTLFRRTQGLKVAAQRYSQKPVVNISKTNFTGTKQNMHELFT